MSTSEISLDLPAPLIDALRERAAEAGVSVDQLANVLLAEQLGLAHSTIYQVSTATALVEGVLQGAVKVEDLKEHGDFGLGTFADLAGEMVVLDGQVYCVPGDGPVREASDADLVPFAVVCQFNGAESRELIDIASFDELTALLDAKRGSANDFYAVRVRGSFSALHARAVCKVAPGTRLVDATDSQAEFHFENVSGDIVGFWFPEYAGNLNVTGWHLHFLDDSHTRGGHVLQLSGTGLNVELQELDDLRISLPATQEFMSADLSLDPSAALDKAERVH